MRSTALMLVLFAACSGGSQPGAVPQPPPGGADLSGLATDQITILGHTFEVWLAKTSAERAKGLMFATQDQLAPLPGPVHRGMLFVFSNEFTLSFWMRNTFIPLDLAYVRADGTIAEIHPLVPLNETHVISGQPVQFALEVAAGTFAALGIGVGDVVVIPPGTTIGAD